MAVKITSAAGTDYFCTLLLEGKLQSAVGRLEDITREGADGHAYRFEPARAEPFRVQMLFTCTAAELTTLRQAVRLLQGDMCSYTDHFGETFTDLACLEARMVDQRKSPLMVGAKKYSDGTAATNHDRVLIMEFVLQAAREL